MRDTDLIDRGECSAVRLCGAVNALEALSEAMGTSHDTARAYAPAAAFLADIMRECARDLSDLSEAARK